MSGCSPRLRRWVKSSAAAPNRDSIDSVMLSDCGTDLSPSPRMRMSLMVGLRKAAGQEELSKAEQGPAVALTGGRPLDFQHLGHFVIRQPFPVPHEQDFPLDLGELGDGLAYPAGQLGLGHLLAGRRAGRQQLAE